MRKITIAGSSFFIKKHKN